MYKNKNSITGLLCYFRYLQLKTIFDKEVLGLEFRR